MRNSVFSITLQVEDQIKSPHEGKLLGGKFSKESATL